MLSHWQLRLQETRAGIERRDESGLVEEEDVATVAAAMSSHGGWAMVNGTRGGGSG